MIGKNWKIPGGKYTATEVRALVDFSNVCGCGSKENRPQKTSHILTHTSVSMCVRFLENFTHILEENFFSKNSALLFFPEFLFPCNLEKMGKTESSPMRTAAAHHTSGGRGSTRGAHWKKL